LIIRKLRDNRAQEDVRYDDLPEKLVKRTTTVDYTDDSSFQNHRYKVAEYEAGTEPVQGKYIKDVTKYKGSVDEAPIQIYSVENGEPVIDEERLIHEIYQEYGEGRVNVYKFGGNPPIESIFENKFIKKVL
jgi:hypothetical protein